MAMVQYIAPGTRGETDAWGTSRPEVCDWVKLPDASGALHWMQVVWVSWEGGTATIGVMNSALPDTPPPPPPPR